MASSALYCINIQQNSNDAVPTEVSAASKNVKPMNGNNSKIIRTVTTTALNENQTTSSGAELTRNNFILLRNAKASDSGHILLRTDALTHTKNNFLLEDTEGGKIGQILIQQSEIKKGVLVQSVKRLSSPIFLLSGGDSSNGHIFIQTTAPAEEIRQPAIEIEDGSDNILVQALEGIQDGDSLSNRGLSTPIGSEADCKGRWKSIRDYYQRKRKGVKKGTGAPADFGDNFRNKFKHLRFLDNTAFVERRSNSNIQEYDDEENNSNETQQTSSIFDAEDEDTQELRDIDSQNNEERPDIQESQDLLTEQEAVDAREAEKDVITPVIRKRARLNEKQEIFQEIKKSRTERTALLRELVNQHTAPSNESDTATSMFFRSIAATVSTFSPQLKAKAKLEVMKVISQLELDNIAIQTPPFSIVSESTYVVQEDSLHSRASSSADTQVFSPQSYMTTSDNLYEL